MFHKPNELHFHSKLRNNYAEIGAPNAGLSNYVKFLGDIAADIVTHILTLGYGVASTPRKLPDMGLAGEL